MTIAAPSAPRRATLAVLVLLLVASAVLAIWTRGLVRNQEDRLLRERGAAAGLVLTSAVSGLEPALAQLGTAAGVVDAAPGLFAEVANRQIAATPTIRAAALLRPRGDGFVVELAAGPALAAGQAVDGARAAAARRAAGGQKLVSTSVFRDGADLVLGFAIAGAAAPPGTVLYREVRIAPGTPTPSTRSAPFAELKGELFSGTQPDPDQLILATAVRPGPGDRTFRQLLPVGDSQWLFIAAARRPLTGSLMAHLPWLVLGAAVAGSLLIAAVIDVLLRRHDYAMSLVDARTRELQDSMASLELAREEASRARDEAMEASRLKSQFLANMSHEIRTPLNGVIGMTGLLLDAGLGPEQQELAETARRSGEVLLDLINDVLDFSKIEAGKLELETSEFDPGTVVEDVAEIFATAAQQKDLEILTSVDSSVPPSITGDPGRVRQVLTNLVSNAVKFTDGGEVAITVTVDGAEAPMLRVAVRDTGVGIDLAAQSRLFEAFTQADASTTRRYGGTGLGLAISKRLTEMMGGSLGVESRVGAGSTFWFTVPLVPGTARVDRPPVDRQALSGLRVLVVDDNATNRAILDRQLGAWGITPVAVPSGPEALAAMRETAFDVVLLDWYMPGVDGLDVAREAAADPALAATRLILLTSVGTYASGGEGIAASLTKPVRRSQLFNTIASVVGVDARLPFFDEPRRAAPAAAWQAPPGRRALVAEDNQVNQRVVAAMLGRLGLRVDVVGDGQEAVAAVAQLPYDLVLMDCQMPRMNGYEATGEIRRQEQGGLRRVPIVALTASAVKGEEERCLAAGMDAYMVKPIRMEDLDRVVRSYLDGDTLPPPAAVGLDVSTVEEIRRLGLLESVASDFRHNASADIAELRSALAGDDGDTAGRAAHRLKGGCLMLGATRMAELAADLEWRAAEGRLEEARSLVPTLERSFDEALAALEAG